MAAEQGKVDPMHQFTIEPVVPFQFAGYDLSFTNSAAWMLVTAVVLTIFVAGGLRRELVPGRWQMAVETFIGF
ncbi:MAG: F0F1 ATP synthase subunit A, partial [Erythrobacter cryptus]